MSRHAAVQGALGTGLRDTDFLHQLAEVAVAALERRLVALRQGGGEM